MELRTIRPGAPGRPPVNAAGAAAESGAPAGLRAQAARRDVLVCIFLRGGADGLNILVPHGDREYYAARPGLAIGAPGRGGGAIDLDGFFGLHPALAPLKEIWDAGHLAAIQACGVDETRVSSSRSSFMVASVPVGEAGHHPSGGGSQRSPDRGIRPLPARPYRRRRATFTVRPGPHEALRKRRRGRRQVFVLCIR